MKNAPSPRRFGVFVSVAVYALALTACKDGTEPLVPATIQLIAGDQQSAGVASAVPVAPSVKVVTSSGKPVPNVPVTFTAGAQSGVVIGGIQVTNSTGVATVTSWTLGTKTGTNTLTVTVENVPSISITATTAAGAASSVTAVEGVVQTGVVASTLVVAPAIRVVDMYDNGVPSVPVTFSLANGGSIETATTQTNANGVASPGKWTLGTGSGTQNLIARAGSLATLNIAVTALADVPVQLAITREPAAPGASGGALSVQPALDFRDRFGNIATSATLPVTASVAMGTGTLGGTTVVNAQGGRVTFTDLTFTGSGSVQLRFAAPGMTDATAAAFTIGAALPCAGPTLSLDYALGQSARYQADSSVMPRCFSFSAARNAGEQYLVLFENMSPNGSYTRGVFPGFQNDDGTFQLSVQARGTTSSTTSAPVASSRFDGATPADAIHGWDFGGRRVYEVEPKIPAAGVSGAKVLRNGSMISANSMSAAIVAGDTLMVDMVGIPRLNIPDARQRAIVRLVTPDIVIAEDIRIVNGDPAFTRADGSRNTPIAEADLQAIADEYSRYARVQSDRFFQNRHNGSTATSPGRPVAVHSMMYADNIWGYTYSVTNNFVWDYWVGATGGVNKGLPQHPQRVADNLFMHEIAHMRHMGLLELNGRTHLRGNRWLVEGFARASERMPIAMRLMNSADPSRIGNITLPFNPAFIDPASGRSRYYYDDVPTYLSTTSSMYDGYAAASYVFDYFADQVARAGGNWWSALAELLVNAGTQTDADAVVRRYLPGIDFGTLFTRARLALYLDDYGGGLPDWTQYHQYNLRASRPPGANAQLDPRNMFPRVSPGQEFTDSRAINAGGSFGYLIDGTNATSDMRFDFTPTAGANGVVSIVRIK
ncbi:MAG: hypothetical protein ACT4O1_07630 [Gemmatimonadota bacterium]